MIDPKVYDFDDFQFDSASYQLKKANQTVPLQPKQAELLKLLLVNKGQLVSRGQIQAVIWPDQVVDFDQSINFAIAEIRKALQDSPKNPRFIQTIARRGYQFKADTVVDSELLETVAATKRSFARLNEIESRYKILVIFLIAGVIVLTFGWSRIIGEKSTHTSSLEPSSQTEPPFDADFKRALYLFNKSNYNDYLLSIPILDKLIEQDPEQGIYYAYLSMAELFTSSTDEQQKKAGRYLQRAVVFNPELVETQLAQGLYSLYANWQIAEAHQRLANVVSRRPDWILARHEFAVTAVLMKDRALAEEQIKQLLQIDPGLAQQRFHAGWFYLLDGRFSIALEQYRKSLEIDPGQALTYLYAGYTARMMSLSLESNQYYRSLLKFFPTDETELNKLLNSLEQNDITPVYRWWIARMRQYNFPHFFIASAYAQMGDKEMALLELEISKQKKEIMLPLAPAFYEFQFLQQEPRFIVMMPQ